MASQVAQLVKNPLQCRRPRLDPWVGKISWWRERLSTLVHSPGESHGQRSLVSYSLCSYKESDMTEWLTVSTTRIRALDSSSTEKNWREVGKNSRWGYRFCQRNQNPIYWNWSLMQELTTRNQSQVQAVEEDTRLEKSQWWAVVNEGCHYTIK